MITPTEMPKIKMPDKITERTDPKVVEPLL
jgi:hypothetical protein